MTIIVAPSEEHDLPAIVAIYNHAVAETNAIWNETLADLDNRRAWRADRIKAGYPVLVAREGGETLGYASFGPFRPFDGYRSSVEHSVYVRHDRQGRGIGGLLLGALVAEARARGFHAMVGGIAHDNAASIALHRTHGFAEVGRMPQIARKFGQWQTLVLMQKLLAEA
jgi:L-amino acid N-acyltransferase